MPPLIRPVALLPLLLLSCLALAGPVRAQPREKGDPTKPKDYRPTAEQLDRAGKAYAADGTPPISVIVRLVDPRSGQLVTGGVADQLEAAISSWMTRVPDADVVSDWAEKQDDARELMALAKNAAVADLAAFIANHSQAKLVVLVRLEVGPGGGRDAADYKGTVKLIDVRAGAELASYPIELHGSDKAERVAEGGADISRHLLDDYARRKADVGKPQRMTVKLVGLSEQQQMDQAKDAIAAATGVERVMSAEWHGETDPAYAEITVRFTGQADNLARLVADVIRGKLHLQADPNGIANNRVTMTVWQGLDAEFLARIAAAYKRDRARQVLLLVGWDGRVVIKGVPPGGAGANPANAAVARGLRDAVAAELTKVRGLTLVNEDALSEQEHRRLAAVEANDETAAIRQLKTVFNDRLIVYVGLQDAPPAAGAARVHATVALIDAARAQTLAMFGEDLPAANNQPVLDRVGAGYAARLLRQYVNVVDNRATPTYVVEVIGFKDEAQADQALRLIEDRCPGVTERLRMDFQNSGGETLTRFDVRYDGEAGDLSRAIRQIIDERLGLLALTYRSDPAGFTLRVGSQDVPDWLVYTDPVGRFDDARERLRRAVLQLGNPRVGVLVNQLLAAQGGPPTIDPSKENPIQLKLEQALAAAGLHVVDAQAVNAARQRLAAEHAQNLTDSAIVEVLRQQRDFDLLVLGTASPDGKTYAFKLVDLRNNAFLGAAAWPDAAADRDRLHPVTDANLPQYLAGSLLASLARQAGKPNVIEVVVKDAKGLGEVIAVAAALAEKVPQVQGSDNISFQYGVGRFMLRYVGPFDAIARKISEVQADLPFKVAANHVDAGMLELQLRPDRQAAPPDRAPTPGPSSPVASPGAGMRPAMAGHNCALIIGAADYQWPMSRLRGTTADATLLYQALKAYCGYDAARITMLVDGLTDGRRAPTRANILDAVRAMKAIAGPDDTYLIYYAGHGTAIGNEGFIIPVDCKDSRNRAELVSLAELRAALNDSAAGRRVLLLDCCHAGTERDVPSTDDGALLRNLKDVHEVDPPGANVPAGGAGPATRPAPVNGVVTLAACRADETSLELSEYGHGLFTYWLVKGITGAAAVDEPGGTGKVVDVLELHKYLDREVPRDARAKAGHEQHPFMLYSARDVPIVSRFETVRP